MKKPSALLTALAAIGLMISFASFAVGMPAAGDKDGVFGKCLIAHVSAQELRTLAAKGCVEVRNIRTAFAVRCLASADFRGMDVVEDEVVHAMDLNADKQIRQTSFGEMGFDGTGRVIAVLDTGIDYNHAELADSYAGGFDFVNKNAAA